LLVSVIKGKGYKCKIQQINRKNFKRKEAELAIHSQTESKQKNLGLRAAFKNAA
jgi:hypothetical protein